MMDRTLLLWRSKWLPRPETLIVVILVDGLRLLRVETSREPFGIPHLKARVSWQLQKIWRVWLPMTLVGSKMVFRTLSAGRLYLNRNFAMWLRWSSITENARSKKLKKKPTRQKWTNIWGAKKSPRSVEWRRHPLSMAKVFIWTLHPRKWENRFPMLSRKPCMEESAILGDRATPAKAIIMVTMIPVIKAREWI